MPSIYDLYEFYLEPRDLQEKAHVVNIEGVRVQEIFNSRVKKNEKRLVVRFVKRRKTMILNKTQAGEIGYIAGTDDYTKWVGVEIVLVVDRAPNGKDTIRVCKRGESGDVEIDAPQSAPQPASQASTQPAKIPGSTPGYLGGGKKPGKKPTMSKYEIHAEMLKADAETAFNSLCLTLKINGDRKGILDKCEGDFRTATEMLMEQHKDKLL